MTDQWHVHFGRLSAAAEGAADVSGGLRKTIDATQGGCVSAASAHPGWSCAASLKGLHQRFSAHIDAHAQHVGKIGDRLTESHQTYIRGEQDSDGGVGTALAAVPLPVEF